MTSRGASVFEVSAEKDRECVMSSFRQGCSDSVMDEGAKMILQSSLLLESQVICPGMMSTVLSAINLSDLTSSSDQIKHWNH